MTRPKLPYELHPECRSWDYSPERVAKYVAKLRAGNAPPPIAFCDGKLLDGAHRLEAWITMGHNPHLHPSIDVAPESAAQFVADAHIGTRLPTLKDLIAYVENRKRETGETLDECLRFVNPKHAVLIRNRLAPKPKAPVIHRSPSKHRDTENLVRVIIPDSHGEHIDVPARDAFLGDLKALDPQEIVMLGDHLDCGGTMSTHQKSYSHEKTESYADDVRAANEFLDLIQAKAPRASMHYLEGNHEQHVERWATREFESHKDAEMAIELLGPATVLKLKSRGIPYYQRATMYMGLSIQGAIKLGECYFVHGVSHAKNADASHLARFGANVVFGHVHRVQGMNERTVTSAGFGAWCPGTLAKLQPLYAHTAPTSWNHGYGLQFVAKSGAFIHINVPIHKGQSLLALTGLLGRMRPAA